jgi:hypothetical protein
MLAVGLSDDDDGHGRWWSSRVCWREAMTGVFPANTTPHRSDHTEVHPRLYTVDAIALQQLQGDSLTAVVRSWFLQTTSYEPPKRSCVR